MVEHKGEWYNSMIEHYGGEVQPNGRAQWGERCSPMVEHYGGEVGSNSKVARALRERRIVQRA